MKKPTQRAPLRFADVVDALRLRKLLFFVLCFALSMYVGDRTDKELKVILAALALLLSIVFILYHRFSAPWKRLPLLAFLPVTLGILLGQVHAYRYFDIHCAEILSYADQTATVTGTVTKVTYNEPYASSFLLDLTALNGKDVDIPVVLELPFGYDAFENDRISLDVTFSRPVDDRYGFAAKDYYTAHGIYLIATATEDAEVTYLGADNSLTARFRELSSTLETRLKTALGNDSGGFSSALLLGRKQSMSDAVKRDFRFLGISHTLAISGLHLSILVGGLLYLLYTLHLPRIPIFLLSAVFILGYMALTGFSPSIVRAGIMYLLLLFSQATSFRYDAPTSLAAAAFLILLFSPGAILDPGFLLSVAATAGLIFLGGPLAGRIMGRFHKAKKPLRLLSRLLCSIALTFSAILFTLPFSWIYLGEFSPVSLLANCLFLPLIRIYLFLSVLVLLLYATPLIVFFAKLTATLAEVIFFLASHLTRFTAEPISLRYTFTPIALLLGVLTLGILLLRGRQRLGAFLLSGAVTVGAFGVGLLFRSHTLRHEDIVIAVTIGNNDYFLLHSGGRTLLCDISDGSSSHLTEAASLAERHCYDTSVDSLLLTHLHRRHITAFLRLADNHRLRQLLLPLPQNEKELGFASALLEAAKERGIEVILFSPAKETVILFDDCSLRLASLRYLDRSVQPIHCLRIEGESVFTYVGSSAPEVNLLPAEADGVLWLGTHGPNIKIPLTESIDPRQVIVSSQEVNDGYGTGFAVIDGYYRIFTLTE